MTLRAREQYEWAIPHIEAGLGAIRLDRLDREDVARWLEDLAAAGRLSWRSIQICRTELRAALADAVEEGLLHRSPAARVPMPRAVAKPAKQKEVDAWTEVQVARFLSVSADHRWAGAGRQKSDGGAAEERDWRQPGDAPLPRFLGASWFLGPSSKPGTSLISSHLAEDAIDDSSYGRGQSVP